MQCFILCLECITEQATCVFTPHVNAVNGVTVTKCFCNCTRFLSVQRCYSVFRIFVSQCDANAEYGYL